MSTSTPQETLQSFRRAFNDGDVDALIALYEPTGILITQPGQGSAGIKPLREALGELLAMKPDLTAEKGELLVAGDIALSVARWTQKGTGPDGEPVRQEGTTADVLRRQADGRWLVAIDNPWGAAVLG